MRLELAERLMCPRDHAPAPLIVVALRVEGRELHDGVAGCPECHLEARITRGAVIFPPRPPADARGPARPHAAADATADLRLAATGERVERTAALLGLAEPGGSILLTGRYAALGAPLADRHGVTAVTVGSVAGAATPRGDVVAVHLAEGRIPFTDHTFRAAALEPPSADAVRTLAIGARLLAPAPHAALPGTRELARDPEEWLAERLAAAPIVQLGRR
jgi:hypothetical protein